MEHLKLVRAGVHVDVTRHRGWAWTSYWQLQYFLPLWRATVYHHLRWHVGKLARTCVWGTRRCYREVNRRVVTVEQECKAAMGDRVFDVQLPLNQGGRAATIKAAAVKMPACCGGPQRARRRVFSGLNAEHIPPD